MSTTTTTTTGSSNPSSAHAAFWLSSSMPAATTLDECIVGPSLEERTAGAPCWSHSSSSSSRRKRAREEDASTNTTVNDNDDNDDAVNKDDTTNATFERAVQTFLSSGCCIIPQVLPPKFVATCWQKATRDLTTLNQALDHRRCSCTTNNPHHVAAAYRGDYRELVHRDGLRRDVRYHLDQYPYTAQGLIYNSMVLPLVRQLLGATGDNTKDATAHDVNLLYMGVMWALPNNNTDGPQKWHADGGHCFEHAHQPPHCINVFIPLIDVTDQHGPTQVKSGSHILGASSTTTDAASWFGLEAQAGDAILFDYRLQHRGRANASSQPRPMLYLAYAKPWFRDAGNTRSGQSIFADNNSNNNKPWVSRLLCGPAQLMQQGFEDPFFLAKNKKEQAEQETEQQVSAAAATEQQQSEGQLGSGERWVLFKMNVELPNSEQEETTIVVYSGDVAVEVSTQFCRQHDLSLDFIPVLAETIQQQMVIQAGSQD